MESRVLTSLGTNGVVISRTPSENNADREDRDLGSPSWTPTLTPSLYQAWPNEDTQIILVHITSSIGLLKSELGMHEMLPSPISSMYSNHNEKRPMPKFSPCKIDTGPCIMNSQLKTSLGSNAMVWERIIGAAALTVR